MKYLHAFFLPPALVKAKTSSSRWRLALTLLIAAGSAGAQMPRLDLLTNSGFEKQTDGKALGWSIRDKISTVSNEKAHRGTWSLKIVDASSKLGSSVYSKPFKVIPNRQYFLRAWVYLDSGAKNGLGLYLKFRDKYGKEIFDPGRKQQIARFLMCPGRWVPVFYKGHVPAGAKSVEICIHTFNAAVLTCYVDDVELLECFENAWGDVVDWLGGTPDEWMTKGDKISVRWAHRESSTLIRTFDPPANWSNHSGVSFWLHANKATGNAFMFTIFSENPKTKGPDYWSAKIPVDWKGWKQFVFSFKELSRSRSPIGWNHVDSIKFYASGWGNTLNPDLIIHLAGFRLVDVSQ